MIGFELTEEQQDLRRLAREFAEREIIPRAREYDEKEIFPRDVCQKAFKAGLMNFAVPKDIGGPGLTVLDSSLITEQLNYGCSGMANTIGANELATLPLLVAGNQEQKETYLGSLVKELTFCAFAITEPGAGSNVAAMSTSYRREGDAFVLNGTKHFISNGSMADWYVTFATSDKRLKHKGISCFVFPANLPGITRRRMHGKTRTARRRHGRDRIRRCPRSGQRAGRKRGRRLQICDGDFRFQPARNRCDRNRRVAAGAGRMRQVFSATAGLRPADRKLPGDPVHDGRHGGCARSHAPADI
jgi:alkylation response protein AidB-like acyl-CoA dehydrogenase